ncbi:MAG: orotidine-5'-phosphate decarboxylase [Bacteroidota bacterium]
MKFTEKLTQAIQYSGSVLCVGLDPNLDRIPTSIKQQVTRPEDQVIAFCKKVIEVTHPFCAAFKPNLAFFEALGPEAFNVLHEVTHLIPDTHLCIADAKRGDISTTQAHYNMAFFDQLKADAVTLNPLMGFETLDAFGSDVTKGIYALTLTSNPGASDFLKRPFEHFDTMASFIADRLHTLQPGYQTHLGMVIGATQTREMARVLKHHTNGALLIPGIGAQGGSLSDLTSALYQHQGIPLINSSRGIIYAGSSEENWFEHVALKASETKQQLKDITSSYV